MESVGGLADGEWNSFSPIYSSTTEESDFMTQLLSNYSLPNDLANTSDVEFSWSGHESDVNMAVVEECPMHSSNDTTSANMYSFSQGSSYTSGGSSNFLFPLSDMIYYPNNSRPISMRNDSSISTNYNAAEGKNMITSSSEQQMYTDNYLMEEGDDFLNQEVSNDSMESGENQHEAVLEGNNLHPETSSEDKADILSEISKKNLHPETSSEDKADILSEISKKRSWIPLDVQKNKRMVKAKKTDHEKLNSTDIINNGEGRPVLHRQSPSSCLSENNDSNASHKLKGGVPLPSCSNSKAVATELNLKGKTRASRGSATDPQSLYAKKRREKINERLRILQNLVPNGTKVDISTMLEEAVQYVKFLQLQIKLLSSDDLWMYAPIAYNGMDIGLDLKIGTALKS